MAYPYNGVLVTNEYEGNIDICCNMDMAQKHHVERNKPYTKVYPQYYSIYMKSQKKSKFIETESRSIFNW